jgi:hypothetical protein
MSTANQPNPPPFSSDLSSLVWPMSAEEFVSSAMHSDVLFRRGDPGRLALLEEPLGSYDLQYLFSHGDEATVWKQGGREVTRGTDSDRDVEALVSGVTVQTHLMTKFSFGKSFIAKLARQMHLESGFFSIFASRETHTATHYDRNYNFTIQLFGEKIWTVHTQRPAIDAPSESAALCADRLAPMSPPLHGVTCRVPDDQPSIYRMRPGDMLYVPPGYWHATECAGFSIQLNLSIEPRAWFQVVGGALMRHLEAQQAWRAPFGVPTQTEATEYLTKLRRIVDSLSPEDVGVSAHESPTVHVDEPLRRTLGSLLMWETTGAGLHFGIDELRFLARGTRGRWIDILKSDMEPALIALTKLDDPKTVRELSTEVQLDCERLLDFVQRLVDFGYLTPTGD